MTVVHCSGFVFDGWFLISLDFVSLFFFCCSVSCHMTRVNKCCDVELNLGSFILSLLGGIAFVSLFAWGRILFCLGLFPSFFAAGVWVLVLLYHYALSLEKIEGVGTWYMDVRRIIKLICFLNLS